jgi:hypothetical protein
VACGRSTKAVQSGPATISLAVENVVYLTEAISRWHSFSRARSFVIADADGAWRIAARFLELREEFVGGFVLRRFESVSGERGRNVVGTGTVLS